MVSKYNNIRLIKSSIKLAKNHNTDSVKNNNTTQKKIHNIDIRNVRIQTQQIQQYGVKKNQYRLKKCNNTESKNATI